MIRKLSETPDAPEKYFTLLAHSAAALQLWYERVKQAPLSPVWPEQDLEQTQQAFDKAYDNWRNLLKDKQPQDLDELVNYKNTKGTSYSSTLRQTVDQLLFHGAYHRGQVNLLLRQNGFEPVAQDYIFWCRNGGF